MRIEDTPYFSGVRRTDQSAGVGQKPDIPPDKITPDNAAEWLFKMLEITKYWDLDDPKKKEWVKEFITSDLDDFSPSNIQATKQALMEGLHIQKGSEEEKNLKDLLKEIGKLKQNVGDDRLLDDNLMNIFVKISGITDASGKEPPPYPPSPLTENNVFDWLLQVMRGFDYSKHAKDPE